MIKKINRGGVSIKSLLNQELEQAKIADVWSIKTKSSLFDEN